jgi:hypothetical protein
MSQVDALLAVRERWGDRGAISRVTWGFPAGDGTHYTRTECVVGTRDAGEFHPRGRGRDWTKALDDAEKWT